MAFATLTFALYHWYAYHINGIMTGFKKWIKIQRLRFLIWKLKTIEENFPLTVPPMTFLVLGNKLIELMEDC